MKINDVRAPIVISPASPADLETAPRLIVLVPEFEADAAIVARRIREVASSLESRIQLLSLSRDAAHESTARRRLVTLSALVEEPALYVETKVEIGNNWLSAVTPHWRPGDVIVCFSDQSSGIAGKSLREFLSSSLNAPVYVLSGIPLQNEHPRMNWMPTVLPWAGSLGLIFSFLLLQIRLSQPVQNGALFYVSLIVEGAAVWFWNNLFS